MVQICFTVWRERSAAFQAVRSSAAFQAVRNSAAGGKPALRTVNLKPGT
ncbi:MAG: hypothetical protein WCF99_16935 [Chloroflexales bacterium]